MRAKFSSFDRRMEIMSILMNHKMISRLELARTFSVSDVTIAKDIIAISRYAPISSKMGRNGGIYIIEEYKSERVYLSYEEERLIKSIVQSLSGKEQSLLKIVLHKFAMPGS